MNLLPTVICVPKLRSQVTPLDKVNRSERAEALKEEESDLREFVENHICPISKVFSHLNGAACSITARFKASASQPISDLQAAGAAALRDYGAALRDTDKCNTAVVDEMSVGAEENEISRATAATAGAKSTTAKRKLLLVNAVDDVNRVGAGDESGADAGEVWPFCYLL